MANITKKVSWSSRGDDSGLAGEGTPLLNGTEIPKPSRQVSIVANLPEHLLPLLLPKEDAVSCFISYPRLTLTLVFKCCMG